MDTGQPTGKSIPWKILGAGMFFAAIAVWLVLERPDVMRVGTTFPPLLVRAGSSPVLLGHDSTCGEIIVLFRWNCPHCQKLLGLLDRHTEELKGTRLYLIASGSDDAVDSLYEAWGHLRSSPAILFGTLDEEEVRRAFGRTVVPLMVFVDRKGIIRERIAGLTSIRNIVSVLGRI